MSTRRAGGHYDATMQLYVDGELLPREVANISTFNHRLRYGGCSRGSASTTDVSAWTSRPRCVVPGMQPHQPLERRTSQRRAQLTSAKRMTSEKLTRGSGCDDIGSSVKLLRVAHGAA